MRNNKRADDIGVILLCIMMVAAVSNAQTNPAQPAQPNPVQPNPAQPKPVQPNPAQPAQPGQAQAAPTKSGVSPATETTIKTLCQGAMYKEACEEVLLKVANGSGTTEDIIKAGATVALQAITKMFNMTGTLEPKVNGTTKPAHTQMAVDDCKDLFQNSIEKLEQAINQLGNPEAYKSQSLSFTLRVWLSDVITYSDNCMDSLGEVKAHDFQADMKGGMLNATQVTMSILDVFTSFTSALHSMGFEIDANKIADALKNFGGNGKPGGGPKRRLLGGPTDMLGDDGVPRWLSEADRELLNFDGRQDRNLAGLPPNAVVAKDGSGQFKTITDAINAYDPKKPPPGGKFVIYVKAGVYDEYIIIQSKYTNIYMYGDGPLKTIITGKKNTALAGIPTARSASFAVQAANFICKDMAFENTAGPEGHQAVALRANGEQQVFMNCDFNGYQDTLYTQGGSQFFRDCTIRGTIDFIFGNGATIFQHCNMIVRQPMPNQFNAVTASGRLGASMPTGIVLQDCNIQGDPLLQKDKIKTYLGRPWKQFARTVFMECEIGDLITPVGYNIMADNEPNSADSFWGEYLNKGPGANIAQRVQWPHVKPNLTREEAQTYTVGAFLPGADIWLKGADVPYFPGFKP